ncbi:MAG TPA: SDR family NAD(P)-dependent oxidoreductase [bacterium]|nr:SDR family NAD(P)-dependent oxidoreductase [bacterium]
MRSDDEGRRTADVIFPRAGGSGEEAEGVGVLSGQGALVFGASSGIGRATAVALARAGAAVVVAARTGPALEQVAAQIRSEGGRADAVVVDVAVREQVDAAVDRVRALWDALDIVVNAAGTNVPRRRLDVLSQADWDELIRVNLSGAFHTIQAALPPMRDRRSGLIVQVSSVSGRWGDTSGAAYQASKHGVIGLCQATMFEERRNGIRVTAVLPGLTDTPILQRRSEPPPRSVLDQALQPEDVAAACVFLASLPARSYVPELIMLPPQLQCVGLTAI